MIFIYNINNIEEKTTNDTSNTNTTCSNEKYVLPILIEKFILIFNNNYKISTNTNTSDNNLEIKLNSTLIILLNKTNNATNLAEYEINLKNKIIEYFNITKSDIPNNDNRKETADNSQTSLELFREIELLLHHYRLKFISDYRDLDNHMYKFNFKKQLEKKENVNKDEEQPNKSQKISTEDIFKEDTTIGINSSNIYILFNYIMFERIENSLKITYQDSMMVPNIFISFNFLIDMNSCDTSEIIKYNLNLEFNCFNKISKREIELMCNEITNDKLFQVIFKNEMVIKRSNPTNTRKLSQNDSFMDLKSSYDRDYKVELLKKVFKYASFEIMRIILYIHHGEDCLFSEIIKKYLESKNSNNKFYSDNIVIDNELFGLVNILLKNSNDKELDEESNLKVYINSPILFVNELSRKIDDKINENYLLKNNENKFQIKNSKTIINQERKEIKEILNKNIRKARYVEFLVGKKQFIFINDLYELVKDSYKYWDIGKDKDQWNNDLLRYFSELFKKLNALDEDDKKKDNNNDLLPYLDRLFNIMISQKNNSYSYILTEIFIQYHYFKSNDLTSNDNDNSSNSLNSDDNSKNIINTEFSLSLCYDKIRKIIKWNFYINKADMNSNDIPDNINFINTNSTSAESIFDVKLTKMRNKYVSYFYTTRNDLLNKNSLYSINDDCKIYDNNYNKKYILSEMLMSVFRNSVKTLNNAENLLKTDIDNSIYYNFKYIKNNCLLNYKIISILKIILYIEHIVDVIISKEGHLFVDNNKINSAKINNSLFEIVNAFISNIALLKYFDIGKFKIKDKENPDTNKNMDIHDNQDIKNMRIKKIYTDILVSIFNITIEELINQHFKEINNPISVVHKDFSIPLYIKLNNNDSDSIKKIKKTIINFFYSNSTHIGDLIDLISSENIASLDKLEEGIKLKKSLKSLKKELKALTKSENSISNTEHENIEDKDNTKIKETQKIKDLSTSNNNNKENSKKDIDIKTSLKNALNTVNIEDKEICENELIKKNNDNLMKQIAQERERIIKENEEINSFENRLKRSTIKAVYICKIKLYGSETIFELKDN